MTIFFDLQKVSELAGKLGSPQDRAARYVHVAGVNGKTSTCLLINELLLQCTGLKVGCFTHPMLLEPRDCIRVNGCVIDAPHYHETSSHVAKVDEIFAIGCSPYEKLFLTALLIFLDSQCDILVVESAMGGSTDATNILGRDGQEGRLLAAVITQITKDHPHYLGHSLHEIWGNVMGIHRAGSALCIARGQPPEIEGFVKESPHPLRVNETLALSKDFAARGFLLRVLPASQSDNIELALKAYGSLLPLIETAYGAKCRPPPPNLFVNTEIAGRASRFFFRDREVIVDAAQNAGSFLCKWLKERPVVPEQSIHLVLGMSHKEGQVHREFLEAFGARDDCRYSFVHFSSPEGYPWIRSAEPAELHQTLYDLYGKERFTGICTTHTHLKQVFDDFRQDHLTVVCGSPHIVREFYCLFVIASL